MRYEEPNVSNACLAASSMSGFYKAIPIRIDLLCRSCEVSRLARGGRDEGLRALTGPFQRRR